MGKLLSLGFVSSVIIPQAFTRRMLARKMPWAKRPSALLSVARLTIEDAGS